MFSGPIHERSISIKTIEADDKTLVIEGTLIDNRLCKTFIYLLSVVADPRIIHHISLRLELSLPKLTIKSAHIDMHEVPHEVCRDILSVGEKLVGISLFKGFNKNISALIGGQNGCLHLFNLLLSMRAAAFQGYFAFVSRILEDGSRRQLEIDKSILLNTCHVWSETGPFAELLMKS